MKRPKLVLVNPVSTHTKETTFTGFKGMNFPPLSLSYIAAITPKHWDIQIIDEAVENFTMPEADLVGITSFTATANRGYEIAQLYRKKGVPVIAGGVHVSMLPEEALQFVDTIVIGEAESVWSDVISDFESKSLKERYRGVRLPLDTLLLPRRDLLSPEYSMTSIQTSRGCPYDCNFCSVTKFNGGAYRTRPIEHIIDELKTIPQKNILFADDNILGNRPEHKKRALDLFKAMIKNKIKKRSIVQSSIDFAEDEEILYYARKSGVKLVLIGFESIDSQGLEELNKKLNKKKLNTYKETIDKIHKHHMGVYASFIMGSNNDTERTILDTVNFSLKNKIDLPIFTILTPLPGTKMYDKLRSKIIYNNYPKDWERYSFVEPVHQTGLSSISDFMRSYRKNWMIIFTLPMIIKRTWITLIETKSLVTTFLVAKMNIGFKKLIKMQNKKLQW